MFLNYPERSLTFGRAPNGIPSVSSFGICGPLASSLHWLLVELQSGHTILVQQTLRKRQCIRKQSSLRDCLTRHLKHPTQKSLRIIRLKMHPCSLPSDWLNLVATHHLETINVYIVVLVFVIFVSLQFCMLISGCNSKSQ